MALQLNINDSKKQKKENNIFINNPDDELNKSEMDLDKETYMKNNRPKQTFNPNKTQESDDDFIEEGTDNRTTNNLNNEDEEESIKKDKPKKHKNESFIKRLSPLQKMLITLIGIVIVSILGILFWQLLFNQGISEDDYKDKVSYEVNFVSDELKKNSDLVKDSIPKSDAAAAANALKDIQSSLTKAHNELKEVTPPMRYRKSHDAILEYLYTAAECEGELSNLMRDFGNGQINPATITVSFENIGNKLGNAKQDLENTLRREGTAEFYGI